MISIQQIKAARGLLDWTQGDLAKTSGMSLPAIAKIEQGQGNPRKHTLAAIQGAFEQNGIEFYGTSGLEKKEDRFAIKNFHGREGILKVWADIARTLPQGGEILLSNLDDVFWDQNYKKELADEMKRRDKAGIHFRALISEDNDFIVVKRPDWYRKVPRAVFAQMPYYMYGNKVCFMMFKQEPYRFVLIESAALADAFRVQFEYNWASGTPIQ